ncbi:MAG: tetratricopeptide repeat protein [Candidatus Sulfotelmatobacter sp.]
MVRDSGNRPVAGATVCLKAKDSQTLSARTDSAGAYRFSAVPQGGYTLRAEMAGYGPATSGPFVLGAKESRTIDLTLEPAKAAAQNSQTKRPEFFDEPHFTVAGVTDTTNLGGHGSDAIVRNREALASATASLRKEPPSKTDEDEAGRHHLLADADERRGDALDAVREYQRAAELNPSEPNLFDWGTELLVHHAAEPAIEVFTRGNRLFPGSVRMLAGLGASWYSLGSFDQAAQRLCEASDLNPDDPNPYLFMGKMQAVESEQSQAILDRLARFAKLQPQNALANYYYAVSLWKRRKSPEEVEDANRVKSLLEKAVHLDPGLGLAYLQLGVVYSEQGDFPKAISAYRQAIEASPLLEQAHYRLAQAYRQLGETAKAHAELQLYEQISKEKTEEIERQRHELQQFVYQLRDTTSAPPQ